MTSVNEMNAYERGKKVGYDIGYDNGWGDCNVIHKRNKPVLIVMKIVIALLIGFFLGVASEAHSASATTSLQVVIPVTVSAEVSCNPTNCPEIPLEETVHIENIEQPSIFSRFFSAILRILT